MNKKSVLITGGAGFIGSNIVENLLKKHYRVTIIDNFNKQIHNEVNDNFKNSDKVILINGDITNKALMIDLLNSNELLIHLAAETGTGQSMYQIDHYTDVNISGTAFICDFLINQKHKISKIVVASSRAIYGEGKYECKTCGIVYPEERSYNRLDKITFNPSCPNCHSSTTMNSIATDEMSKIHPTSIYGLTKQVQEQMILMTAKMINISAFALRYQNVYGPGQSLINPYTGILSIFSKLAFFNSEINIFEDGNESRDFVYIDDVVDATVACLENSEIFGQYSLNIGSGEGVTVHEVAKSVVNYFNSKSVITVSGAFREGDIRHNIADITLANKIIGFSPKVKFNEGIKSFLDWAILQKEMDLPSKYEESINELSSRGLFKK